MTAEPVSLDDITHWAPRGSCDRLLMLRLDRVHPVVSGNKWFKLGPCLAAAATAGRSGVLSFGGGYSNHLVALAFAARKAGLRSHGLVRGIYEELTPSLRSCDAFGMKLHFVQAAEYASLRDGSAPVLTERFPDCFIIPEGGANAAGITGAAQIAGLIPASATDVCVAVGTGTTLAGLDSGLPRHVRLHGFCAAKNCGEAEALIERGRFPHRIHWHPVADPRFGRWKPELLGFMQDFRRQTDITLDIVYTGKMMQKVHHLLIAGEFTGRQPVCVHTGGLQGNPDQLIQI